MYFKNQKNSDSIVKFQFSSKLSSWHEGYRYHQAQQVNTQLRNYPKKQRETKNETSWVKTDRNFPIPTSCSTKCPKENQWGFTRKLPKDSLKEVGKDGEPSRGGRNGTAERRVGWGAAREGLRTAVAAVGEAVAAISLQKVQSNLRIGAGKREQSSIKWPSRSCCCCWRLFDPWFFGEIFFVFRHFSMLRNGLFIRDHILGGWPVEATRGRVLRCDWSVPYLKSLFEDSIFLPQLADWIVPHCHSK